MPGINNNVARIKQDSTNRCEQSDRVSVINVLFAIVMELENRKEFPAGDDAIRTLVNAWENKTFLHFGAERESYLLHVQQQKRELIGPFPLNIARSPVEALRDSLRVCVVLGSSDAANNCIGRYKQLTEALLMTLHRHQHHRIPSITLVRMISGILQTIERLQQRANGLLQILAVDIGEERVDALFKLSPSQLRLVGKEMLPVDLSNTSILHPDITFSLEKLDRALIHSILANSGSEPSVIGYQKRAKATEGA